MSRRVAVAPSPYDFLPPVPNLIVRSDDLVHGAEIPVAHRLNSAGGENLSPHLAWSDAPAEARGYAVTCFDPDAPSVSGFWHWLLVGIPADVTDLATGIGTEESAGLPKGSLQLRNDFCDEAYSGAAPPPGDGPHRYLFAVSALDTNELDVDATDSAAYAGFTIVQHTIARGIVEVTFER